MTFVPEKYHRQSIRLQGYDYAQAGAYFVTVCTQNRECVFGEIMEGEMRLNDAGVMIQSVWDELPQHYLGVDIDTFTVMPNHIHGVVVLNVGAGPRACPPPRQPPPPGQPQGVAPTLSLPDVVHRLKSLTTARYRHGVHQYNWHPFPGRLWHRNYYEHVIRDEEELHNVRQYVINNPLQWEFDQENPLSRKEI